MTVYDSGEILLLRFPFTDGSGGKQRPALVLLDTNDGDIIVARITTKSHSTGHDVALEDWVAAGLLAASTVRLHKLATLETSVVKRSLGNLTPTDFATVTAQLAQLFA